MDSVPNSTADDDDNNCEKKSESAGSDNEDMSITTEGGKGATSDTEFGATPSTITLNIAFGGENKELEVDKDLTFRGVRHRIREQDWYNRAGIGGFDLLYRIRDDTKAENYEDKKIRLVPIQRTPAAHWQIFFVFVKGFIGWSPPVWLSIKKLNRCRKEQGIDNTPTKWTDRINDVFSAFFIWGVFLVDLFDAVVDLILGIVTQMNGSSGKQTGFGILTVVMTIIARCVTGLYGLANSAKPEEYKMIAFAAVELTVFMMEDGAAILLLASNPERTLLKDISTWLSLLSTILLLMYSIKYVLAKQIIPVFTIGSETKESEYYADLSGFARCLGYCCSCYLVICWSVFLSPFFFMIYVLFEYVIMRGESANIDDVTIDSDNNDFSGRIKHAAIAMYVLGVMESVFLSFCVMVLYK